ncbi:MAG: AEC family transporter [Clostridia bacterium]|nr:AEC family transporter [Clostridia bacterium]
MQVFFIALVAVAVLVAAAIPGYLLVKKKIVGEECIPGFSKILVYVCQPCLAVYTFKSAEYSVEKLVDIGIFAILATVVPFLIMGTVFLFVNKKSKEQTVYRIVTIASSFGNCAFFGIPIIEALFPPEVAKEVILYTTVYSMMMNITGWTVGSAIISRDIKYISVKKIFLNPAVLGTALALVLFIGEIPVQKDLLSMITAAAKMATPLSMMILGMRLATMRVGEIFSDYRIYLTVAIKQLVMPVVAFAFVFFLPIDPTLGSVFFIISACPVAAVVLTYSEMVGEGQRNAASMLLAGTLLSVVTLPIMTFLLPLIK